jgi:nucleotide-binding universal stress UspA family protein
VRVERPALKEPAMQKSRHSETHGVVVVGVDRSAGAREALRWAMAEARLRRTRLRAVHASTPGFFSAGGPGYGYPYLGGTVGTHPGDGFKYLRRAAGELLEQVIADVGAEADGLEIERQVFEGGAVEALIHAVGPNDLLVVGSRGHGGFAGLLLGSVSANVAEHAHCPVLVIHGDEDPMKVPA